jgi:hypothetical protein
MAFMMFFGPFPFVLIGLVLLAFLILSSGKSRRQMNVGGPRVCGKCDAVHPAHANYCRRCGQRLV